MKFQLDSKKSATHSKKSTHMLHSKLNLKKRTKLIKENRTQNSKQGRHLFTDNLKLPSAFEDFFSIKK